jgi:protease IV
VDAGGRIRKLVPAGGRPPRVLAVDLSRPVVDEPPGEPLARLRRLTHPSLKAVLATLDAAGRDRRVAAIVVRVDDPASSWAHAGELRDALVRARAAGTRVIAHAQTFGEGGDGARAYHLATACDEIHLQPSGLVGLVGVAGRSPFAGELLERLDVVPEVARRHEYKSALEVATERGYSDASREMVDRIVASHHEQLVGGVAEGRSLSPARAAELVGGGPWLAAEALAHGLVDRTAYRDETVAAAKAAAGQDAKLITVAAYDTIRRRRAALRQRRTTVALIHGSGPITVGRSQRSLLRTALGGDTIAAAFDRARRDDDVRAIIWRIDSPGGSAVASDTIRRAVMRAREAGTPVVATMGAMAGSGGYWVAMDADRIIAQPTTLTGSIGVIMGKFVTRGLGERIGLTTDEVHRGEHALMFSSAHRFTDDQRARLDTLLDHIYADFVGKVAEGRGMTPDAVHEVARGRVWTGADALERGLIDQLGGYHEAELAVRELLGLAPTSPLKVQPLPHLRLSERLGVAAGAADDARAAARLLDRGARALGGADDGVASVPAWVDDLR